MTFRRVGYILLCVGIGLSLFAFISDSLGIGKEGVQAAQLLLIQFGVFVSALSFGFINLGEKRIKNSILTDNRTFRLDVPILNLVLVGFFVTYVTLFVAPMF